MNTIDDPYAPQPKTAEWYRPNMRVALAARDFTSVYKQLVRIGCSQHQIARLTGQAQPEVSAIIHGRRVMAYDVMDDIISGLGIPRCLAGMGTCCHDVCPEHPAEAAPARAAFLRCSAAQN